MIYSRKLLPVALTLLFLAGLAVGFHMYSLDGLDGWFLYALDPSDARTIYGRDYTDAGFRSVHLGMSEEDVTFRLGDPLSRYDGYWWYSNQATPTSNYHRRMMNFQNGVVVEKISDFYID